jgi:hypothetical protein
MGWLRKAFVGDKPEPVNTTPDRDPRLLTEDDIQSFMSLDRELGMATYQEILLVLEKLRRSDPVRVARIKRDLRWVGKKGQQLGINWSDLP